MLARNYFPAVRYGAKWHPTDLLGGGLQNYGGNQYFVKLAAAEDYAEFLRDYNFTYSDGTTSVGTSLATVYAAATANRNDIVYLYATGNAAADTTQYQSVALDLSKDLTHVIGVGASPVLGQRARIAELSTVKTIEDLVTVSGDGCIIANLAIFQGVASSTATAARAMVVSGQRNQIVNCQISGNGDTGGSTDDAGARSLAVTGAENTFQHCYIGLDTVIRATQTAEIFIGAIARTVFEDCFVQSYTSLSTFKAIQATSYDRFFMLKDTILSAVQNITSAVAPTGAIGNTTPNGNGIMLGGGVFGYADVTTADDTKMLVLTHSGLAANVVDQGVAKGTDVA